MYWSVVVVTGIVPAVCAISTYLLCFAYNNICLKFFIGILLRILRVRPIVLLPTRSPQRYLVKAIYIKYDLIFETKLLYFSK